MHVRNVGSYYKCILYMQLITGHAGTCTSIDIVKVYGYLSPTPTPHPPLPKVYIHVSAEKFKVTCTCEK